MVNPFVRSRSGRLRSEKFFHGLYGVGNGRRDRRAEAHARRDVRRLTRHDDRAGRPGVELFDPVPATMVRLAGRERAQLLVQSPSRPRLHAFLTAWRDLLTSEKSSSARWALDVDPLEL